MDYPEEEYKSVSSSDVIMEKEVQPGGDTGNKKLEVVEEENEKNKEEDIEMEDDSETFLSKFTNFSCLIIYLDAPKPQNEIFKNSNCREDVPKKLLDKFHELLKKIKQRVNKPVKGCEKSKQGK